jgi:6-phosphogluconolactonase (cycloisomerase 2 family)
MTNFKIIFVLILQLSLMGCDSLELSIDKSVYLNTKIGNPSGGSAIKLFDIVADTKRNKIYVQSILASHIAVIDAETDELEKYIDSKIEGYHLSYMAVQESTGHLFIADRSSKVIVKIDPSSGNVLQTLDLSETGTPAKISFLNSKNYLLVSYSSKNKIIAYRASDLQKISLGLNSSKGINGPQGMKIRNGIIYAALASDGGDYSDVDADESNSGIAIIDSSDWSVEVISIPYKGAAEIAVDATNDRYYTMNSGRISMKSASGSYRTKSSNGIELQAIQYSKKLGLIVVTRTGEDSLENEAPYGSIEIRNPETLEVEKSISLGMKSSKMAVVGELEKIFITNMADASVSRINYSQLDPKNSIINNSTLRFGRLSKSPYTRGKSIDVGTSIEAFKLHPNGKEAFLINRLGGSSLMHYDYSSDVLTEIQTRNWPAKIELSSSRQEVYVYSHFASSIEVFDINTHELKATIELTTEGLSQGRSDLIPNMALNNATNKLYISLPEQGKIVEVNVKNQTVTQKVNAFSALEDSGDHESDNHVGTVQLAVDSISHRLFIFYRNTNKLEIRDPLNSMELKHSYDVSDKISDDVEDKMFNGDIIKVDTKGRRLFIGQYVYSISGGDIEEQDKLKNIDAVVAWYDDYIIGADIDEDKNVTLKLYEKKSESRYSKVMSDTVGDMITNAPRFEYSEDESRLYVTYMSRAKMKIYDIVEK